MKNNLKNLIKKGAIYSVISATLWTALMSAGQYMTLSQGIKESRKYPEIILNLEEYEKGLRSWPSEKDVVSELDRKIFPYARPMLKLMVEIPSRPGRELAYWVHRE